MFQRALKILAAAVMALVCAHGARGENGAEATPSAGGLYDTDPNHLWNRLDRALFARTAADGTEYGRDELDPLLWYRTKHLLEGPSHDKAIAALDEFLATHGEGLIRDPLKRAILQRDLWAVFDWTARSFSESSGKARQELQGRLAAIIARLALTREQIDALPDNYAAAAQSGRFEKDYNEKEPATPFLPADLFSKSGPWVCVGLDNEQRVAPSHVTAFGGRSAFLVFMRTPGGWQEATDYLKQFREFPQPYFYVTNRFFTNQIEAVHSQNLPQFPAGTVFALVRQAILVGQNGELVPTHLTESAQMRRYNDVHPSLGAYGRPPPESQSLFEFKLGRKELFGGVAGGLRAYGPDEKEFRQFMDKGFDPFEQAEAVNKPISTWMHPALDCVECHRGRGVYSVSSFLQLQSQRTVTFPQVAAVDAQEQRDAARIWKQEQFNWGLLQGLWAQR